MPRDFNTILCPCDFSEESYRAMEYAERFARATNGTVLLAHIIHVPSGELRQEDGHMLTFEEGKQRALTRLTEARDAHLHGYPKCEIIVDIGSPASDLIALAQQRAVDLIVISTHGRTGLEHILIGSVAEAVLRQAPCPVFVLRRGAE
jgi:universal stress protein A